MSFYVNDRNIILGISPRYLLITKFTIIKQCNCRTFTAFVLPIIDYCNSMRFDFTHDIISQLQRIQNYVTGLNSRIAKSAKVITHKNHFIPFLSKLGSLTKYHVCATSVTAVLHHHMSLIRCRKSHYTMTTVAPVHTPCLFSIDPHSVRQHLVIASFLFSG